MNKMLSRIEKGVVKENPDDQSRVMTDKSATSTSESLDRFMEAMARVLGTSKEGLEAILFQGQSVKQVRRNPPSANIKRSRSQSSPL